MSRRQLYMLTVMVCLVFHITAVVHGQKPLPQQGPQNLLTLETTATRKAAVQAQLKEIEQSNLSKEEQEKATGPLRQLLAALITFEEASQRRDTYQAQVESLPERLEEMATTRNQLEKRSPRRFPNVTESLRADYEAQRRALEAELDNLTTQATAGGVRLARLPEDIQERQSTLEQLEREYQEIRLTTPQGGMPVSPIELLDVQIQAHRVDLEALQVELTWLTKRGPLHDALAGSTRLRLSHVQDDLRTIQAALGETLQEQLGTLAARAAQLQQALEASTGPVEKASLQVRLETVSIQQSTAGFQQQLAELNEEVHLQETRNTRVKQDTDRLTSLVEKYSSGERAVQRLRIGFERLRRERQRFTDNPIYAFQSRLRMLTEGDVNDPLQVLRAKLRSMSEALFTVDDRLYEFDRFVDDQLSQLTATLASASPQERTAARSTLRLDLEAQRAVLREQQQVITGLTQAASRLIALHREHEQLLDDGYRLVLSKMFWLKNSENLSWIHLHNMTVNAVSTATRIAVDVRLDLAHFWMRLKRSSMLWGLLVLLFLAAPWIAKRIRSRLRESISSSLNMSSQRGTPPSLWTAILLALQAAVWPAYLALLAWSRQFFITQDVNRAELSVALVHGLYTVAFVLGIGLFGRALLRPEGWGQRFWELSPDICRFLRRAVTIACIAGIVFLVPRQVVLAISPDPVLSAGSQTLARLLFLAFQAVILVLILRVGWRSSPLMERVLARSHDRDGLIWRIWPFIHLLLLCSVTGVMTLDILGYRYAAQFVWLNGLESLSIALGFRLVLLLLLMHFVQKVVRAIYNLGRRRHDPSREQSVQRSLAVLRMVSQIVLTVIALSLILELWGVSAWSLLTSQLGSTIATRAFICLITIGIAIVVIQVSNVITEYILRPRFSAAGEALEISRKLRTLTPLVQTILKVTVAFIAVLVLLEQINIQTGPILAGVGIFGLAVGFASQSLIKDVINGMFILFEDSISVGDIGAVRGISGVVEKITLRAVTIRDLQGDVHVIPNSTIDTVTNRTKGFSRYLLDVKVAYREDVDTVMDILREVDQDMRYDLRYRFNMLEPIEMWGLDRFDDSAVYIRARLKTRPGKQWEVGREFNRRMKKVFDERDIEIPFPHRTHYWGRPKNRAQRPIQLSVDNHDHICPENRNEEAEN